VRRLRTGPQWVPGLRRSVRALMLAAETGAAADIEATTEQLELVVSRISRDEDQAFDQRSVA
jgi:hypothetical protein